MRNRRRGVARLALMLNIPFREIVTPASKLALSGVTAEA